MAVRKPNPPVEETKLDKTLSGKIAEGEVQEVTQGVTGESSMVAVALQGVPTNTALPCTIYLKVGDRFLTFRRQGEKVTPKKVIALQSKNHGHVYIHKAFWRIFSDSFKSMNLPEAATEWDRVNQVRLLLAAYGQELHRKAREPRKPVFDRFRKRADEIAAAVQDSPRAARNDMIKQDENPVSYFSNHANNAAVYACLVGGKLGLSLKDQGVLAYACMVHDIGNLYLPKRLLYKKHSPTDEEWELLQTHARRGAEFLQSLGAEPAVVLTALQSHERYDGKGYPSGIAGKEIHLYARICAVIDAFDAMTSHRPFEKARTDAEAIEEIEKATREGKFDPTVVAALKASLA